MFKIQTDSNTILPLQTRSVAELGLRERAHLQEWMAKQPSCLGEELLIIQKEFSDFSDTQERLDLLAPDKQGHLSSLKTNSTTLVVTSLGKHSNMRPTARV